jgi:hypothetical protein
MTGVDRSTPASTSSSPEPEALIRRPLHSMIRCAATRSVSVGVTPTEAWNANPVFARAMICLAASVPASVPVTSSFPSRTTASPWPTIPLSDAS